ncbi:ABC transporter cysteine exporter CydD [Komagataeibacter xylinus NBRC 13693]|uniref:ABC transporter cysteine exporter CydD n=1 Tax=Komagataeibacter xylinus NBRC 13693 TaxID=1234668 RepID=A0A0D6Q888_KOMXY|nr:ABC transporter cysteine exporter CydD [Komagataeibacter xylinus NBRC 13693]
MNGVKVVMDYPGNRTLIGFTRRIGLWLGAAVVLGGAAAVMLVLQLAVLARIVSDLAFHNHAISDERAGLLLLLALLAGRALLQWAADMVANEGSLRLTAAIRGELLRHLFNVGPVGLTGQATGHMVTVMGDGIAALEPYFAQYVPRAAMMVVLPLLVLGMVAHLDAWSFVILACTGPLIPVFMALVGYRAQAIMDRQWTQLLLLGSAFLDTLQGLTTLRLFGRARDAVAAVAGMADEYRTTTMSVMKVAFLTSAVLEFFASLSIALVAVVFGARLLDGKADFQSAFLVLLLAPEYFMPLRAFSASYHARQNATAAMAGISQLFALPETATRHATRDSAAGVPLVAIRCEDVTAGYQADAPVLSHAGCTFRRNTLTVITGESGVGKTTLIRLLLGLLQPMQGHVTAVDECGMPHARWQDRVGWVPQQPRLIHGTVAENLRLADPMADMDTLRAVAAQADALSFIEALPQGFDTPVGERGACLSGGQVQRLALARVLLRNPQVLILDEPTASLDLQSEQRVAAAIARAAVGRIGIVVAHRPAMIAQAAQVVRLRDGRLFSGPSTVECAA